MVSFQALAKQLVRVFPKAAVAFTSILPKRSGHTHAAEEANKMLKDMCSSCGFELLHHPLLGDSSRSLQKQVYTALQKQVYTALQNQVYTALQNQVYTALQNQVYTALQNQLYTDEVHLNQRGLATLLRSIIAFLCRSRGGCSPISKERQRHSVSENARLYSVVARRWS